MEFMSLSFRRGNGDTVTERYTDGKWQLELCRKGKAHVLAMYDDTRFLEESPRKLYAGLNMDGLLDSGKDILGEALLKKKSFTYTDVETLLPPLKNDAYCFLSGPAAWAGVLISPMGEIYSGVCPPWQKVCRFFSPAEADALGAIAPKQMLLGGHLPVLLSVHSDGKRVMELMHFVEPGDTDRDPLVWTRKKTYSLAVPEAFKAEYFALSLANRIPAPLGEADFLTVFAETLCYWVSFDLRGTQFSLPEPKLQNTASGCMMAAASTFTSAHPHYGHKWYGEEVHDNFPPNYIWTLEAACLLGRTGWAQEILRHLFSYALNDEGRFVYRQGDRGLYGASAEEYGQLLFLLNRYHAVLNAECWTAEDLEKLTGMGELLLSVCVICPEFDGRVFVRMCAEADTNTRVHVYLNNNLWVIRGLSALEKLLSRRGIDASRFGEMAALLAKNVAEYWKAVTKETKFGPFPPFRLGYTAEPATLSSCRETFSPMTDSEFSTYMTVSNMRAQGSDQDLTENTYANYRYYLEALSAMLLPEDMAKAVMTMRENLGGEFLGMTRFYRWFDDWPVLHYARYLLETGCREKFRMLLYAHTAHHGHPDLMCYYEQADAEGGVRAPDCLPSILTTPIMTGWMFAYETVERGTLLLLDAVPENWYDAPFSAKGIGYSEGTLDLVWDGSTLEISFSSPLQKDCLLRNLTAAACDAAEVIPSGGIRLKQGITCVKLTPIR